jgi:hypothetical protein
MSATGDTEGHMIMTTVDGEQVFVADQAGMILSTSEEHGEEVFMSAPGSVVDPNPK